MYNIAISRNTKEKDLEIKVIGRINAEEYQVISRDMDIINHFRLSRERMMLLFAAIDDIKKHMVNQDLFCIKRSIMEIASNFYIFIQNIESQTKRLYGAQSVNVLGFSKEFDNCFAYRFLYKLRNMIIHVDFPNMSVTSRINESNKMSYELSVECESLFSSYKEWGKSVSNDLKEMVSIDLISVFEEIKHCVWRITLNFLNLGDVKEAYYASKRIMQYKSKIERQGDGIIIFRYNDANNPNVQPLKLQDLALLPINDAEAMQSIISLH